jgi:hypothetical protein
MNNDGRSDVIYPMQASGSIVVSTAGPGGFFPAHSGTAGGDYFMSFNVPNQTAGAPDPVVQLQGQFNTWRAALVGKADAVQSVVTLPVLHNQSMQGTMHITLRDWSGQVISTPNLPLTIQRKAEGPENISAGSVVQTGPGRYEVTLTAASATEHHRDAFEITVHDPGRAVVLMPLARVRVWQCVTDFNGDGDYGTDADIEAFFACLAGNCCELCLTADIDWNGDTGTDADIEAFFFYMLQGCGP